MANSDAGDRYAIIFAAMVATMKIGHLMAAKRPALFSLETPVQVDGKFDDFAVGVTPADAIGTVILLATSPIHVPVRWLFDDPPLPDGVAACETASGTKVRRFPRLSPSGSSMVRRQR